ncbi:MULTISPECIES: FecR domain-containing protein [unclassified Pseudomonas]|uniref:FecR family protein n=1 Tax=unclassified Pseudomonas TaxID=196821 RepID=UPI00244D1CBD|nr:MULTISPECIES: FecR domain-containing protein [unclassified Pseudomonas]MDG9930742.1 FecR domain-containing protein [Pseudomonas sp. GD04042]MDH0481551.1 FecR domain-containing protein [Pseudomonas sp. GD04015]MDH0603499.1 FecR domain-containing protein [Pseudomonas sp. GD03869]
MTDRARPDDTPADPLAPFEQALRARVPSREALLAEAKAQTARQRRRKQALGGGLSVLLLATGLWLADPAWQREDVRTAAGGRDSLTLVDGSRVVVNGATHLRVERRLRSRQVELVEGEATFTVEHGPTPFIVRSQGVDVLDIGTVFNVRSDSRGVAVAVVEGAVEVSAGASPSRRLGGGQQVLARAGALGDTERVDPARATAWQQGKLRFDGTPLSEVIVDIQRYRQAPVRLADPRLGALRVSGEYDSAAIESLIDLLPAILPVRLSRAGDGSVVMSGR